MHRFPSRDGLDLSHRELGDADRPLLLFHGFTADGTQWTHAAEIAAHGYRVILPDLRGHGASASPHDPASYPPDVLADDGIALINWLGLEDYDLGGYSLGAQTVLRMLVRGARPARAIVAGYGLAAAGNPGGGRLRRVLTGMIGGEVFEPGSPEAQQAHWIRRLGGDPQALLHILGTQVATQPSALAGIATPTLVAVGDQDQGHATAGALATTLPNARFTQVPGDHFSALTSPELAASIISFLGEPA
ncbi:alpha/beta fold hydrolase [Amycolatopsis sp. NPDC059657]|uniref:alpha/beta fold hydrolase n=1 Tax=Amycolatopsis sp. NPDC059657 TaxID=3346899 RepID=UPI00366ABE79